MSVLPPQLKQFDVGDVEGLVGRYSHVEHGIKLDGRAHLSQFYGEKSLQRRLAMIRQARKGGAVSPEAYVQLKPYIQSGRVDLKTYRQVGAAAQEVQTNTVLPYGRIRFMATDGAVEKHTFNCSERETRITVEYRD